MLTADDSPSLQNTQVEETQEFRHAFFNESKDKATFRAAKMLVWCYRGENPDPRWKDVDSGASPCFASILFTEQILPDA